MIRVRDFRKANGSHDLAKLLPANLLRLGAGVFDVEISKHHPALVAGAGDGVLAGNVLAVACLGRLDFSACDGSVVPALGQWLKVSGAANGQGVNAKFFVEESHD